MLITWHLNNKMELTIIDKMILNSYKNLLEGLADYLGDGYEFVLHSVEDLDNSVIKIVNGHHTGRKEGAPMTDLALGVLKKAEADKDIDYLSYHTKNKKGEPLKSSTIMIKGEKGIIGLLCINFYLNTPFIKVLESSMSNLLTQVEEVKENYVNNPEELIIDTTKQVMTKVNNDDGIPVSLKNKEIVTELYDQGMFEFKNAVERISEVMEISKNTVYLHLRSISKNAK